MPAARARAGAVTARYMRLEGSSTKFFRREHDNVRNVGLRRPAGAMGAGLMITILSFCFLVLAFMLIARARCDGDRLDRGPWTA